MNHALDLDTVLQVALQMTIKVARMEAGGVLLLNPDADELLLKACIGDPATFVPIGGSVKEGLAPHMLASVLAANRWGRMTEHCRLALEEAGTRSLLSIPLVGGGHVRGVMVLVSRHWRVFDDAERELYAIIGRHVGSALCRIHLQARELRMALLEERQAMARQMHDDVAQTLAWLGLCVDEIVDHPDFAGDTRLQSELEKLRRTIEGAYQRVRRSIARLGQDIPTHFDLRVVLQGITEEFERMTQHQVGLDVDVDWLAPLSPLAAVQISYIVQEALNNTRRHAQASMVKLSLCRLEDGAVELVIQDNGTGFDVASLPELSEDDFGLRFMAQRAKRVGGTLRIKSEQGRGTQIIVHLPS
jgi:two-component system nitrate/nitrite sensor histidine kinase NarX